MRTLPNADSSYPPILLVRTHYGDDAGWGRVWAAIDRLWVFGGAAEGQDDRLREEIICVEDPEWAGATPADVLETLASSEGGWEVVYLADAAAMGGPEPTLLAVSTDTDAEETIEPFRIPALETPHAMHCNLSIANMSFEDFRGDV